MKVDLVLTEMGLGMRGSQAQSSEIKCLPHKPGKFLTPDELDKVCTGLRIPGGALDQIFVRDVPSRLQRHTRSLDHFF